MEDREGRRAVGGSPLDGGRQVCHGMTEADVVAAPPGGPSSPAVEGLEVAPVVVAVAASGRARGVLENHPSVVVLSVGLETVVTVGEVGVASSVGLSENCSGSLAAPPTMVFEGVVVAAAVDLLLLPALVAFGGLAEVLPLVAVAVEVVVSSDWLRP